MREGERTLKLEEWLVSNEEGEVSDKIEAIGGENGKPM